MKDTNKIAEVLNFEPDFKSKSLSNKNRLQMSQIKPGQVYDQAFIGMPKEEIAGNLAAIAYKEEERFYTRNLSEEELENRKHEYSEVGIKLAELEEKKKAILDEFKERMKAPKERAGELINAIKFKSEQQYGKLFLIDDQEAGLMQSFDTNGVCVDTRPLTREERQIKMKAVNG